MSSRDAWIKSFNLNTLATQFFTASFVPLLLKSSAPRLIFISSFVSSLQLQVDAVLPIDQSPPAGWPKSPMFEAPAYRASKTSLNMVAREWSRILKNDGVVVHIAALSRYATAFGGGDAESKKKTGAPDASVGGEFVRSFVEGERDGDQGKFVSEKGVIPW
jgi:NAD(P)-dependent dehydrogenase (short-subunit alcohol dehydrogenase family)